LKSVPITTLRTDLSDFAIQQSGIVYTYQDSGPASVVDHPGEGNDPAQFWAVKVIDVINQMGLLIDEDCECTVNVPQTFRTFGDEKVHNFSDLVIYYKVNTNWNDNQFAPLFASSPSDDPTTNEAAFCTLMALNDAMSVLEKICSTFLLYPTIFIDEVEPNTPAVSIAFKQRGAGDERSIEHIASKKKTSFYGYDGIKTATVQTNAVPKFSPDNLNVNTFAILGRKFEFISYFWLYKDKTDWVWNNEDRTQKYTVNNCGGQLLGINNAAAPGTFFAVKLIDDIYTSIHNFLLHYFSLYWTNPSAIELDYVGTVGLVEGVKQLDKITVDNVTYTIIEIQRDFLKNTLHLKGVQY